MRLQLLIIDHQDGTLDLVWNVGRQKYARTVNATDVNTRAKLGNYLLSQITEFEGTQTYFLEAHQENGQWVLDSFTGDDDRNVGKDGVRSLPGWATWSASEAETWIEDNVTNLASAKTALKAMAKMLIHLRKSVF